MLVGQPLFHQWVGKQCSFVHIWVGIGRACTTTVNLIHTYLDRHRVSVNTRRPGKEVFLGGN